MAILDYGANTLFYGLDELAWGRAPQGHLVPSSAIVHTLCVLTYPPPDSTSPRPVVHLWSGPGDLHGSHVWKSTPIKRTGVPTVDSNGNLGIGTGDDRILIDEHWNEVDGSGRIKYENIRPYEGDLFKFFPPAFVNITPLQNNISVNESRRVEVTITMPNEFDMAAALEYPGKVNIDIEPVYSVDGGENWNILDRGLVAVMSNPRLTGAPESGYFYVFEAAILDADVDRGIILYWNDDSFRNRSPDHANDSFFSNIQDLLTGARLQRWPPLI